MTTGSLSPFLLILLAVACSNVSGQSSRAEVKDQNVCNSRILRRKGIEAVKDDEGNLVMGRRKNFIRNYAKVIFPGKKLSVEPDDGETEIKIPGCFKLVANDVKILGNLTALTAEFEMRLGALPGRGEEWPPPLQCDRRGDGDCPCGAGNACMHCDFCKNLNDHISSSDIEVVQRTDRRKKRSASNEDASCDCDIKEGVYDIKARICTPENLEDSLPIAVQELIEEAREDVEDGDEDPPKTEFTLYTILSLYNERFDFIDSSSSSSDSSSTSSSSEEIEDLIEQKKRDSLIGCHFIITDVFL